MRDPSWRGTVHLVFQPAEEGMGGAQAMLADGLLDRFPMERIFGYHNWPGLAAGTVAVHPAPVMAAAGRLEFRIKGQSGHAALPHLDPRPGGRRGASGDRTAVDRLAHRRSAGERGRHHRDDAGGDCREPDPR